MYLLSIYGGPHSADNFYWLLSYIWGLKIQDHCCLIVWKKLRKKKAWRALCVIMFLAENITKPRRSKPWPIVTQSFIKCFKFFRDMNSTSWLNSIILVRNSALSIAGRNLEPYLWGNWQIEKVFTILPLSMTDRTLLSSWEKALSSGFFKYLSINAGQN